MDMETVAAPSEWAIEVRDAEQRRVVALGYDGAVVFGEHLTIDEAARQFWDALRPYVAAGQALAKKGK